MKDCLDLLPILFLRISIFTLYLNIVNVFQLITDIFFSANHRVCD